MEYTCRCLLDEMRVRSALSREMLRYHPAHPSCPAHIRAAEWERRVKQPRGYAATRDGHPVTYMETVEVPSPTNPLGAKGIGSVATVPAPAAVANAVLDALAGFGVRHLDTPLTAEKIWRAMQGVGESTVRLA